MYAMVLGLSLWGIKSAVSYYIYSRKRENINKLQARISVLKMHLRGKVKGKSNRIESVLKKDPGAMANLTPKLKLICSLEFSAPEDYQTLIDNLHIISEEIISHIHLKMKKEGRLIATENAVDNPSVAAEGSVDKIDEICKKLVRYDKANMIIMIDIICSTKLAIEKIIEFNELKTFEKKTKELLSVPQPITIENFDRLSALLEAASKTADAPDFPVLENGYLKDSA